MSVTLCLVMLVAQLAAATLRPHASPAPPVEQVEVVLYTDFQCPFCALFARPFRELQVKGAVGVQLSVQFKHFPLDMHPAAQLAHQTALAAAQQGKFWEMHDLLFKDQSGLTREKAMQFALKLGLDVERFSEDMESERLKQIIAADRAEGERLGVQGTPTFFINGKGYSGVRSFEELKRLVEDEARRLRVLSEVSDVLLSRGPAQAPVTLELFADLQSPVTRPALVVLDEAARKYPSKVRIQFRNFPLSFHPQAPLAHEAAMVAAAQGHFWEFISFILDHQEALREQDLIAQAGRLGLDQMTFAERLGSHHYLPRVAADLEAGARRGLRGSPVIFVNGRRIDGVPTSAQLIEYIETELAVRGKKLEASATSVKE